MGLRGRRRSSLGFTLLELLTSILVVAILAGLIVVAVAKLRARAQRLQCMANLKNLSVAANLYIQQHQSWPQIPPGSAEQFADAWITALQPFGAERKTWICPTMQKLLRSPDYSTAANARIDYFPTAFDSKPTTPHQWPTQPWFIESGDVHGSGNLIIFTDGRISDVKTVLEQSGAAP